MAIFPTRAPNPFSQMQGMSTSAYFHNEERAYFARDGRQIHSVQLTHQRRRPKRNAQSPSYSMTLTEPSTARIDGTYYVPAHQRKGDTQLGCDPSKNREESDLYNPGQYQVLKSRHFTYIDIHRQKRAKSRYR